MTTTEAWTVGRLLEWTTEYLRKNGSESPRLEAEILLAHCRKCKRISLYTSFAEEPSESERAGFREMVRQRAQGAPVAYLVGHKEFYSIDFTVTPDCLIPRPETEHLVMAALDWVRVRRNSSTLNRPLTIVDVCTGSGCVAISIAKQLVFPVTPFSSRGPDNVSSLASSTGRGAGGEALTQKTPMQLAHLRIIATDISQAALKVAEGNLHRHELVEYVELLEGDLLEALPSDMAEIDLIVANPPYVSEVEFAKLSKDVREFEPKLALVSENDGFAASLRLLEQAESRLAAGGAIMLESSPMVIPRLESEILSRPQWLLKPTIKDLSGHQRIVTAERVFPTPS